MQILILKRTLFYTSYNIKVKSFILSTQNELIFENSQETKQSG